MTNKSIYYVYAYLDPRKECQFTTSIATLTHEPFYIGKGIGRRLYRHLTEKTISHKTNKIKKIINEGFQPIIIKLAENLTELDALELEKALILEIGTFSPIGENKSGPLTNMKIDGVVQKYSDESKQKMKDSSKKRVRNPHSEETKKKMRETAANKTDAERKQKSERQSAALKGRLNPEGHSERMSKLHKGKKLSEDHKRILSEFSSKRIRSDAEKKSISDRQKKTYKIEIEISGEILETSDLRKWCENNNIKYGTLFTTKKSGKFTFGYRIISTSGGTH